MSVRYPQPQEESTKPGDTAKRVTVFLFGFCFGVVCVAALFKGEFGFAMLLGTLALIFIGIAVFGGRRSVGAATEVTDITNIEP